MLTLCRTCTLNKDTDCCHSESERCLTGTWCTPELFKSLDLRYKIMEVYEVWHFENQMVGLFSDYVNTFLKIKQEASGWPENCDTEV